MKERTEQGMFKDGLDKIVIGTRENLTNKEI